MLKLLGELDNLGHMAQLLVEIRKPLVTSRNLPLLVGAQITAKIKGRKVKNVFKIKRKALYQQKYVWTVDNENKLHKKAIKILWREADFLIVSKGISNKARVVVSELFSPEENSVVKVIEVN